MTTASDNLIGLGTCPVCNNHKARFTVSKKSLACMTCNACNSQIFARSDSSDEKLRGFIKPAATTATPPPPAPASAGAPPAAPTTSAAPPPKPAPSWGFFGAMNA